MRTLIFEQWQGGHYFNYLECLIPSFASFSDEVVVAVTGSAAQSKLFAHKLAHLEALPNVRFDTNVELPIAKNAFSFRLKLTENVLLAIDRARPDYVLLTSGDEQLLVLPFLAMAKRPRFLEGVQVEALIHYRAYTARANARQRLVSGMQTKLLGTGVFDHLHCVNFMQYESLVTSDHPAARIASVAGDPVPQAPRVDRRFARTRLGLDPDGRYLGMVGELDGRKAVPAALAAFASAGLAPSDKLLLAGRLAAPFRQLINDRYRHLEQAGRLKIIDRYLSEGELNDAFSSVDCNVSVYNDFTGLSSLMLKSIAAGVPVMASGGGWGSEVIHRFGNGMVVDPQDISAFSKAMQAALDDSQSYVESEATKRLLRFHGVDNFCRNVTARAEAKMVGSPRPMALSWAWVMEAVQAPRLQRVAA